MKDTPPPSLQQHRITEVIKILVIGEGGVGKTTLIQKLVTGKYSDQSMTIGVGFASKTMKTPDGREVKLQIWDIAGDFGSAG